MLMVFSCQKVYDEDCLLLSLVMFLYVIYLYDDMNLYVGRISMYIYVFREEREQERVSEIENGKLWQYIELYLVGACQVWYMSQISIIHLPQEYEWKMQLWEKSYKHFKYFFFSQPCCKHIYLIHLHFILLVYIYIYTGFYTDSCSYFFNWMT